MADNNPTTSPIVRLDWEGTLTMVAAPASHARQGYPIKVKAKALTLHRANGATEAKVPAPGSASVAQLLSNAAKAAILARMGEMAREYVKADTEAHAEYVKANPKAKPEDAPKVRDLATALRDAQAAILSAGTLTIPVTGRASRVAPLDLSGEAMALATSAESESESESESEDS